MITALILVFLIGYLGIVFEHKIGVDKSATAILTGVSLWTLAALGQFGSHEAVTESLIHQVGEKSGNF